MNISTLNPGPSQKKFVVVDAAPAIIVADIIADIIADIVADWREKGQDDKSAG